MSTKTYTQNLVKSASIKEASLHVRQPVEWHIYGYPFLVPYSIWAYLWMSQFEVVFGSREFAFLTLLLAMALHALAFLICQWSVSIKTYLTCRDESDPYRAQLIKIMPMPHHGAAGICEINRTFVKTDEGNIPQLSFMFQKKKFLYNDTLRRFVKLDFPASGPSTMSKFQGLVGLKTDAEIQMLVDKYGENRFDIPIPTFQELFQEHAIAPFFVFQVFCVGLWFLDDMWYYSLFTLFMLFVFESTVVLQRLTTLREFRSMSIKPYELLARRKDSWVPVQTYELLPGDVVSVIRSKEDCPVPCDMLLLDGSCIANEAMLSGESTPQLKENISLNDPKDAFSINDDKLHVLFGGTKIIQVSAPGSEAKLRPPDGGALALVLRTGFSTQQGKLVRTIVYSTERVTANNLESLLFILFLLVFAIIASAYVWIEGNKMEGRKRSKILLDCILIITSVVPPELPMELSLAVNNSLIALARAYVFCTEPFRIPFAGKVEVCCFDKTGTLTAEDLRVEGVAGLTVFINVSATQNYEEELRKPNELPDETNFVLAAAHALVHLDEGTIGDPMEKNSVNAIGWTLLKGDVVQPRQGPKHQIRIIRRFPFASALKRMSTVSVLAQAGYSPRTLVAVKGAPEILQKMYTSLPAHYEAVYKYWARRGSRVLALGYKHLDGVIKASEARELSRDAMESKLTFAGFLIFHCPLKPDAIEAVRMLNNSSHRCVMITGDNALTACHVAKEVEIVTRKVLIGDVRDSNGFTWRSVDEAIDIRIDTTLTIEDPQLKKYDLCLTGKGLLEVQDTACFNAILPRIWVYARVSPSQKEFILTALRKAGYETLMCGDGTNDVGALKQAHVGIALLNGSPEDLQKMMQQQMERRKQAMIDQQKAIRERWGLQPLPDAGAAAATTAAVDPNSAEGKKQKLLQQQAKLEEQMNKMMGDTSEEPPTLKFGDASVAAPFTSKLANVESVCNIVRQGRCTLVAMIQMYKILALNCLISAYSMSVLYLAGIKQGDWQATIAGLMITVCFFSIAKSSPMRELSKKRPQTNVFNLYLIPSILGQAAVHVFALMYIREQAILYAEDLDEKFDLDAEFHPNLLNSGIYLVSLIMQISTFAINYQGHPFRESIRENKPLWNGLISVTCIACLAASELFPTLNDWMQLVPFPGDFKYKLMACMGLDFGVAWLIEQVCSWMFSDNKPKASLLLE
ncbi:hypothetical protein SmJEL517_g03262 [Synchytrium microbalum]|uniref:Cation-transporting P-type ATPase N-terminal domain-containing protein n=1 Tax=Synchytrium microbalum TaxID=1806994 RepID=A0A507C902_9FUNG|nr:uncharacterized protein SmJEL517_g03262 [Synchytrium microbalum]TPX34013.1 hypothetical protein SmJEL517_g03262 [Synchytrium microbalum]